MYLLMVTIGKHFPKMKTDYYTKFSWLTLLFLMQQFMKVHWNVHTICSGHRPKSWLSHTLVLFCSGLCQLYTKAQQSFIWSILVINGWSLSQNSSSYFHIFCVHLPRAVDALCMHVARCFTSSYFYWYLRMQFTIPGKDRKICIYLFLVKGILKSKVKVKSRQQQCAMKITLTSL